DAHIGNLLDALEDPNHDGDKSDSVLENTLIVFASDNGGQSSGGAGDALSEFTGNGVLRGAKGAIYEGAIRVPMIMKWQGKLAAGGTSTQVVDVTDMLPTFCELAGIDAPAGLDGVSLAPTLTGNGHQRTRDFIIHEAGSNSSIIRGDFKLISKNSSRELYNLATDPSESNNIATSNSALADELEVLLLGERTKEGDNFANTYHHWTGSNNGDLSDASNWSDYDYSNNSISYLSDSGAPRVSWTARIENTTSSDSTAVANSSVSFLSLHIKGGSHKQSVNLTNHTITGRNEIRISENATLLLDNGTLDSLRWVDVQEGGNITGAGGINGSLYHSGSLKVSKTSPTSTSSNGTEIVLNGGFETGNGSGSYSYTDLANWMTNGSDPSLNGSVNNTAQAGNNRGLIQGAASDRDIYQNTTDTIALGDSYTFSFWHQGFSGWSTGEEMEARLYYLNAGNPVTIFTQTLALTNGTWKQETYNVPAIADTNAVGKQLHISFSPANGATGYASIDSVSLLKNGTPTSIPGHCRLTISKDYHVSASATTDVLLGGTTTPGEDYAQIIVAEKATLNGSLTASLEDGYTPNTGDTFIILTASEITGKFQHADDTITIGDHSFSIIYNAQSVVLKKVSTTAKGTPHSWLDSHGLSPNYEQEDLADGDNDGIPTWQEFIAGTNPADSTSVFRATVEPLSVTENAITWELKPARRYYIESSDSLGGFSVIAGPFTGDDSSFTYPLPITAEPKRFYRIRVERM
ncbi:MAG: sulfatase/phosphatase domain-containing protein, partial [Akkermansiaceae bacterium]